MPVLLKKRVAFIHVPKTGGTTIESVLMRAFPDDFGLFSVRQVGLLQCDTSGEAFLEMQRRATAARGVARITQQHWTYSDVQQIVPDIDDWWSFAFVRNPWSRLFSEYRYRTRVQERRDIPFAAWLPGSLAAACADPSVYDNHLRPQWQFLGPRTDVYRYEDFDRAVASISDRLGITLPSLPSYFRSGSPEEYVAAYTPATADLVAQFYREDIARFGYRFPDGCRP